METLTPALTFERAAELFMEMRKSISLPGLRSASYVRLNTEKGYKRHTASLELFFHGMTLAEIRWFHLQAYQVARVQGDPPFIRFRRPQDAKPSKKDGIEVPAKGKAPCPVKPQQVKQELCFLIRLKTLALCWTAEDKLYFRHLQAREDDVQRALSPQEQAKWLDVSRSLKRWEIVHWYSIAAFDTLMSTNELRGLRIGDVDLQHRLVTIPWPAAKNPYRKRVIPLENADVLWAFERLLSRAYEMGARDPQHYLFPWHETRRGWMDPTRHMTDSGLKSVWQEVREATGLLFFRPYDTRHTGATRYAEAGTPVDIIVARMGHAADRMRQLYTHISTQAQRQWVGRGAPQHGYAPRAERPFGLVREYKR